MQVFSPKLRQEKNVTMLFPVKNHAETDFVTIFGPKIALSWWRILTRHATWFKFCVASLTKDLLIVTINIQTSLHPTHLPLNGARILPCGEIDGWHYSGSGPAVISHSNSCHVLSVGPHHRVTMEEKGRVAWQQPGRAAGQRSGSMQAGVTRCPGGHTLPARPTALLCSHKDDDEVY